MKLGIEEAMVTHSEKMETVKDQKQEHWETEQWTEPKEEAVRHVSGIPNAWMLKMVILQLGSHINYSLIIPLGTWWSF